MEERLKNLQNSIDQQKIRFRKGLGADLAFLVLMLILFFVNIYSYFKLTGNPAQDRLLIFIALYFFLGWNVYEIVKNSLGLWGLNKTEQIMISMRSVKSEAMKIPTWSFFSGFFYDMIDKYTSEYVFPLAFHLKKNKENLLSLNIREVWCEFLFLSTGIAMFVSQIIYYGSADFSHWEMIFGLLIMLVSIVIVFGYMIPRQVIINKQIRLNNQNKISEEDYYDQYRFFYVEKVLSKFWNIKVNK